MIVQGDGTVLLDLHSPRADEARRRLAAFAELVRSPEHLHTYRIDVLSVWNVRAAGLAADAMVEVLEEYAKYPVPEGYRALLRDLATRYGRVVLGREDGRFVLRADAEALAKLLSADAEVAPLLGSRVGPSAFTFAPRDRGWLKQALTAAGFPAEDLCGYEDGDRLAVELLEGEHPTPAFTLRPYQEEAVAAFLGSSDGRGGSGIVVLPCGAGKTVVALAAVAALSQQTLMLCTSNTAVAQWRRELLSKTSLRPDDVAEYSAKSKEVGPITLATYQMVTWRPAQDADFPHLALFDARRFGLIVYDEVHVVPAPIFRATALLQARRRLGLTATLVLEDGREADVFSLIGPKRFDVPWRVLEDQGFVARAACTELRLALSPEREFAYATAPRQAQFRIAAENERKEALVADLLDRHPGSQALVIGEYLAQLEAVARALGAPLVTGKTPEPERRRLFDAFRRGEVTLLVLSRVGNFALDLPDADLLIQVSGTYGSRQEEAQRLGRILRPKEDGRTAHFYTLVSRHTREEDFALNRQRFLTEHGYAYRLEVDASV
ncbi:MAG: DEAD/DEAH box helicase [Deltaproteobacteria bacterium]|nr:DEAD/DEAH box helicase [Deltaproteobacteria bacterium]